MQSRACHITPVRRGIVNQSKYGDPEGLPPIVYTNGGIGSNVSGDVSAMAEMWEQNLGVTLKIENIDYNYYYQQIYSGNHGQILQRRLVRRLSRP